MIHKKTKQQLKIWGALIGLGIIILIMTLPHTLKLTYVGHQLKEISADTSAKLYYADVEYAEKVYNLAQLKRAKFYQSKDSKIRNFALSKNKIFILLGRWAITFLCIIVPYVYLKHIQFCVARRKIQRKKLRKIKKS